MPLNLWVDDEQITHTKLNERIVGLQELINTSGAGIIAQVVNPAKLGSAQAALSFTSIPDAYFMLHIILQGRSTTVANTDDVLVRLNNVSSADYAYASRAARYDNVTLASNEDLAATSIRVVRGVTAASAAANMFGQLHIFIPNYGSTELDKMLHWNGFSFPDAANQQGFLSGGGLLNTTGAINRVDLTLNSGANFDVGTRYAIFGMGLKVA
jgi:hypothetical protein